MRRAERLFRLVNEMRTRGISRAQDLADYFEISVRTIYRDIAHLQASGLPIEGEAGVGYLLRPGFDLPAMSFTFEQLDALTIGLSFVETAGDTSLSQAVNEVKAKLQASLPNPYVQIMLPGRTTNIGAVNLSTFKTNPGPTARHSFQLADTVRNPFVRLGMRHSQSPEST